MFCIGHTWLSNSRVNSCLDKFTFLRRENELNCMKLIAESQSNLCELTNPSVSLRVWCVMSFFAQSVAFCSLKCRVKVLDTQQSFYAAFPSTYSIKDLRNKNWTAFYWFGHVIVKALVVHSSRSSYCSFVMQLICFIAQLNLRPFSCSLILLIEACLCSCSAASLWLIG